MIRFKAIASHSHEPIEMEVFLPNHQNGYTPLSSENALVFHNERNQTVPWYAMMHGVRVAHGEAVDGEILLLLDETTGKVKVRESRFH